MATPGGVFMLTGDDAVTGKIDPRKGGRPNYGIPKFFVEAKKVRDPDDPEKFTYRNVEYVEIIIPGDNRAVPVRKVTDGLRDKYRPYYDHWRAGLEESPIGTPLEMWPVMTPAHVHQLKAANIFTVEQLVDVSDANLQRIPQGRTLQNKARTWLETKQKTDRMEADMAEKEVMKDAMNRMEDQIASLQKALEAKDEAKAAEETPDVPDVVKQTKAQQTTAAKFKEVGAK